MSKTSIFPISDLVFQFASFGFPNMKLALQNKQIEIGNIEVLDIRSENKVYVRFGSEERNSPEFQVQK